MAQPIMHIIFEAEQNQFHGFLKKRDIQKLFCFLCLDKLIYLLNNKIYLPNGNLSSYLLKLQFTHFGLLDWYRIVQN